MSEDSKTPPDGGHFPDCGIDRERKMVTVAPNVWCDPCIAPIVAALNAAGIATVASCCGHGHRPGNIALRDGRELFIAKDFEEARAINAMFPIDINGDRRATPVNAGRSGEDAAQILHHHFKPSNMTDADWHGDAVLGADNSWRAQVNHAAQDIARLSTTPRPTSELVEALRKAPETIARLKELSQAARIRGEKYIPVLAWDLTKWSEIIAALTTEGQTAGVEGCRMCAPADEVPYICDRHTLEDDLVAVTITDRSGNKRKAVVDRSDGTIYEARPAPALTEEQG